MALETYLQTLNVRHGLRLDDVSIIQNVNSDFGGSIDLTNVRADQLNTQWDVSGDPVCEGMPNSLLSFGVNTDFTTRVYSAEIDSRADINAANAGGNDQSTFDWSTGTRTMACWFRQKVELDSFPTAILGHGGATNNQILSVGLGGRIAFQSADSGEPYLFTSSIDTFEVGREYFICGVWEHHTQHSGAGNRIILYVNGKLQNIFELTGTDSMASATGQPFIGNAGSAYQSFGAGNIGYLRREKEVNLALFFNNHTLVEQDYRNIFERTCLAQETIEADTVENQQAALDLLIGNDYSNTNLAIRILQATDETDYRLFVDNITFPKNDNLDDISIQFIGDGELTIEKSNGSNPSIVSLPIEVERVIPGGNTLETLTQNGGSVVFVNDVTRLDGIQNVTDGGGFKLVLDTSGLYNLTNSPYENIEVINGADVTIITDASVGNTILTNGTINLIDSQVLVTTPAGYDDSVVAYSSLDDALNEVNPVATGADFVYSSALFGAQTLIFRVENDVGIPAFGSFLVPTESGVFNVPIATTDENSALGNILLAVKGNAECLNEIKNDAAIAAINSVT